MQKVVPPKHPAKLNSCLKSSKSTATRKWLKQKNSVTHCWLLYKNHTGFSLVMKKNKSLKVAKTKNMYKCICLLTTLVLMTDFAKQNLQYDKQAQKHPVIHQINAFSDQAQPHAHESQQHIQQLEQCCTVHP